MSNIQMRSRYFLNNCFRPGCALIAALMVLWMNCGCVPALDAKQPGNALPPSPIGSVTPTKMMIQELSPEPGNIVTPTNIYQPGIVATAEYPTCQDDLEVIASFGTAPDGAMPVAVIWPGEDFKLDWRIRNSGDCIWDSAYALEQVNAENWAASSGNQSLPFTRQVAPGESANIHFDLQAPLIPGEYLLSWHILNGYREPVGQAFSALIRVPGDEHSAPLPTMTASPNVKFEISSTQVAPHGKVALTWDIKQANAVYFYPAGQVWQSNRVPLTGVRIYYPTVSTQYNLRVVNKDLTVESYKREVEVSPALGMPEIVLFELLPDRRAPLGRCIEITWSVRGGLATSISLLADEATLLTDEYRQGAYTDCPTEAGLRVYTLVASGPSGTVQKTRSIVIEK